MVHQLGTLCNNHYVIECAYTIILQVVSVLLIKNLECSQRLVTALGHHRSLVSPNCAPQNLSTLVLHSI